MTYNESDIIPKVADPQLTLKQFVMLIGFTANNVLMRKLHKFFIEAPYTSCNRQKYVTVCITDCSIIAYNVRLA